jgi:hypothetical protein
LDQAQQDAEAPERRLAPLDSCEEGLTGLGAKQLPLSGLAVAGEQGARAVLERHAHLGQCHPLTQQVAQVPQRAWRHIRLGQRQGLAAGTRGDQPASSSVRGANRFMPRPITGVLGPAVLALRAGSTHAPDSNDAIDVVRLSAAAKPPAGIDPAWMVRPRASPPVDGGCHLHNARFHARRPRSGDYGRLTGTRPWWHRDAHRGERLVPERAELELRTNGDRDADIGPNVDYDLASSEAAPHDPSPTKEVPDLLDSAVRDRDGCLAGA